MSVDPLADQRSWVSPYNYVQNNPLNRVDPTGMLDNPIYGEDGTFLGTDNKGLQGEAIVMNSADFKQGMSHEEAISIGTTLTESCGANCVSNEVYDKVTAHHSTLSSRPDYDGKLTLSEANEWYRNGGGEPLFVYASKINLNPVYKGDIAAGESQYVNFASPSNANLETGLVYGTIKLSVLDGNGNVKLGGSNGLLDNYGFEMQKGRTMRNIFTKIGKANAGQGTSYNIFNYGTARLNNKPAPKPTPTFPTGPKY